MKTSKIIKPSDHQPLNVLGTQVSFLCKAEETDKKWSLMEVSLPFNAGPPPHHHPWDEAYYVTEGKVKFIIGKEEHILEKGDFVYAPADTVHGFFGAREETSKVLVFDAPSTAGGFFVDCDSKIKNLPQDLEKVPGIAAEYDMHFLKPE